MPEDNRALIQRYFDAFNEGRIEDMLDCLSTDVVHDINQGVREIGKDAFKTFLIHMNRCYEERVDHLVILGDARHPGRFAAEFTVLGTYKSTDDGLPEATGQRYSLPAGTFFEVDEGRISRVTTYYNLKDWIAQVSGK